MYGDDRLPTMGIYGSLLDFDYRANLAKIISYSEGERNSRKQLSSFTHITLQGDSQSG